MGTYEIYKTTVGNKDILSHIYENIENNSWEQEKLK
jgi:hypothetical protein